MELITIYKISCYGTEENGLPKDSFSLSPWDASLYDFDGEDDGGREYVLPKGYSFELDDGVPVIVNEQRFSCSLQEYHGLPVLVDSVKKQAIILEKDKKILRRREIMGFTRGDLAGLLGISQKELYEIENGEKEPGTRFLQKAARLLQCELTDLI